MAYKEDINATLIITVGLVSGLVLVTLAVGVQAWFLYEQETEVNAKWAASVDHKSKAIQDEQFANLHGGVRWIDKDKKIAAMPIEQAMDMVVKSNGKLAQ